ncbi:hypothetical protein [Nocardia sp. CNY236]|uniref:hypothetical protein n=1 Tax=Nocardia sp. CNY236 TaxID=1169152 RepID=UPI00040B48A0|nr:hypothetical protein [Nocardia sp. CNY236]
MKRSTKFAGALAAAAAAPVVAIGTAEAATDTVFFSVGSTHCAIFGNGAVGCNFASPVQLSYYVGNVYVPMPMAVSEMVIDQPWLPAHPTFDPVRRYTLAGGNPSIYHVQTGSSQWGPIIEHAGASCQIGYRGSFSCGTMGQGFASYGGIIVA